MSKLQHSRGGAFLLSEAPGALSRDNITMASGHGIVQAGTVLGKITASGKYAPSAGGSDGSEDAAAILFDDADTRSGDASAVAIRRKARIVAEDLVFADGVDEDARATKIEQLNALGLTSLSSLGTGGGGGGGGDWLLSGGLWSDAGVWDDAASWED